MNIKLAKKISITVAKKAGKFLMDNIDKTKDIRLKAKSDIVTNIDLEVEKIIITAIKKHFPNHKILSEEKGLLDSRSEYSWIIDPIDGSINYLHRQSPFRVGLCLLKNSKPIMSTLYNPVKKELYYSEKGKGSTLNDKKIHVSENNIIENSVAMTHLSSRESPRKRTIFQLNSIFENIMHMRMYGSGLASMSYVAHGRFNIFFNIVTYPWDILPGVLLVEEAGGTVTDIQGNAINEKSTSVLATNGKVHQKMLKLLKNI